MSGLEKYLGESWVKFSNRVLVIFKNRQSLTGLSDDDMLADLIEAWDRETIRRGKELENDKLNCD